jgi:hypothetical protein
MHLRFVATDSVEENIARVLQRAQAWRTRSLGAGHPAHLRQQPAKPGACDRGVRHRPRL